MRTVFAKLRLNYRFVVYKAKTSEIFGVLPSRTIVSFDFTMTSLFHIFPKVIYASFDFCLVKYIVKDDDPILLVELFDSHRVKVINIKRFHKPLGIERQL